MSELSQNLADVIQDRADFTTDVCVNLTTGASFSAEVETNLDPLTLPPQYMDDPREKIRLNVTDYIQATGITVGHTVQVPWNGQPTKFEILSGYATKMSFQSNFLAREIVPGLN